jgi:hypothetical protein
MQLAAALANYASVSNLNAILRQAGAKGQTHPERTEVIDEGDLIQISYEHRM